MEYKTTNKYTKERLQEISNIQKTRGLTPENIVSVAKKKSNPLHDLFEWDDKVAGHHYRLQQARVVVNEVKVIVENKEFYAYENVKVEIEGEQERQYLPRNVIMNNEYFRRQVIERAWKEITYWRHQYNNYTELQPIFDSIDQMQEDMNKVTAKQTVKI